MNKNMSLGLMAFALCPISNLFGMYELGFGARYPIAIKGTHPSIIEKMDEARGEFHKGLNGPLNNAWCRMRSSAPNNNVLPEERQGIDQIYATYYAAIVEIARKAGNLMPKQTKLDCLAGDGIQREFPLREERKVIIKSMIEDDGISPNDIRCDYTFPVLYESIELEDMSFTEYLLKHGAKAYAWRRYLSVYQKPEVVALVAKYKAEE